MKYLQQIAKQNNIRGYSKLQKEDLKTLLRTRLPRMVYEKIMGSSLDEDIPKMSQKPLQPTQYVPSPPEEKA